MATNIPQTPGTPKTPRRVANKVLDTFKTPSKSDNHIDTAAGSPKTPRTPGSGTPETPRRAKSKVWDNFKIINEEQVKCTVCGVQLAKCGSSTSNMAKHLKNMHGIGETLVSSESPAKPKGAMDKFLVTKKDVPKMSQQGTEYKRITSKVADYIIDCMRPLNTVEEKPFRDMMEEANPR